MLYSVRQAAAGDFEGDAARGRVARLRGRRALRPARPRAGGGRRLAGGARARRLRPPRAARRDRVPAAGARSRGGGARLAPPGHQLVRPRAAERRRRSRASPRRATAVAAQGLELGYHNHDAEVAQGFLERLPDDGLPRAGCRLGLVRRRRSGLAARAAGPLLHVKDFRVRGERSFCPVGDGAVEYERIVPGGGARRGRVADRRAGRARGLRARGRAPLARSGHHHARGGRVKVGVMGCGVISRAYVENASAFDSFELVACADLDRAQANALGKASGLAVAGVDELIADPAIDVVLNLTPPLAHAAITRAGARRRQARLHREAARDRRGRGGRAGRRGRAPRAAHRLRARHLPRLGLPGRRARRSTTARSASRSRSAPRCSSAARRPGTRTPTSSTPTAPARCSTWARTT